MRIGVSLTFIAIGAILKFAITRQVNGIDVGAVGVIFMIIGALGLLITLILMTTRRRTDIIRDRGVVYSDPGYGAVSYPAPPVDLVQPVPGYPIQGYGVVQPQAVVHPARTTYIEPRPFDQY
jgi:hypothetical protein